MGDYGDAFNAAVAAELRGQRAKQRITIDELVRRTGYAKSTVLNYLNGHRDIPLSALAELCRALDVSYRAIADRAEQALNGE
ncbi:Helix-turn-helix domain protein [Microbacterium ginsengisoli]|uniref:Helix-turn-helix domain protein n=1 Tax=Microbacterium ginsengisoli TaxID=400772 RepID=A0A0F0LXS2_9MICO|nr:helix-turn-helix transcriptional regulator [Microbacterium ginsengisoli]KJL37090.1 Helix-turn-helix domain protein [Microbacterium ginsengisoli]